MSRTEADHYDLESIEIAEPSCRSHERLDPLGVADVPRVHHDEVVDELVLARPRVVARLRRYLRRVDPVRNHDNPLGPGAFGDEPVLIVSPIETIRSAPRRYERTTCRSAPTAAGFVKRPSLCAVSGNTS